MECQREPHRPGRVLLTDQALVAVTIARRSAEAHGHAPTSADLLVGMATEAEGWAGHLLRRREAAVVALVGRQASLPPGLAPLDAALARARDDAEHRPPGTRDLLLATLAVGGPDLPDLLSACGIEIEDLRPADGADHGDARDWGAAAEALWTASSETLTLDRDSDPPLDPHAGRAIGRVRAVGGGAVDLVLALAASQADGLPSEIGRIGVPALVAARDALEPVRDAPPSWDAGLDAVLSAVAVLTAGRPARPYDLLQAALVAGGSGPLAVLEHAGQHRERRSTR